MRRHHEDWLIFVLEFPHRPIHECAKMQHAWIPRLESDAMPEPLQSYLAQRVKRLSYLGEMFKVGANAPEVLQDFLQFTDSLKKAIPFDIGETVVLTIAGLMQNAYERNQHERLCLRSGISREWITEVQAMAPDASKLMSAAQRRAQTFAMRLAQTKGLEASSEFDALAQHFSPSEAIAITFLVGRYITHALLVNTLGLTPPVPSIFEDGFTA